MSGPTVHATAVLVGARALLIRGASGSGKSRLALDLLQEAGRGGLPFARLVGDDRVHLSPTHGRLLIRPAHTLGGLLEVRGLGILRMPYEPAAVTGGVVDLGLPTTDRLPACEAFEANVEGIHLPRLAVAAGREPLPLLLAWLRDKGSKR
jgi:HPr kinase/phosphorylase